MKARLVTLIKFGIVGVINTLVDYAVSNTLVYGLDVYEWLATAAGYCCGVACSYILNRRFTFKTKGNILRFIIVNMLSLTASILLGNFWASINMQYWLGKALTIAVTMIINFTGYRFLVFSGERNAEQNDEQ